MRYPATGFGRQQSEFFAELKGLVADESVVRAVKILDDEVKVIQRKARAFRASHNRADALTVDAVLFHSVVELARKLGAVGCGQIRHRGEKVGGNVAEMAQSLVVRVRDLVLNVVRDDGQERVGVLTAAVGRIYRRQRRDEVGDAAFRDGVTAIKTALGVRDDVDLFRARLAYDLADALGKLLAAEGDRGRGVVVAVKDARAVALELARDASPIVEDLAVAEADAVDEQDRVFRRANALVGACTVDLFLFRLKFDLAERGFYYRNKTEDVRDGDESADQTDGALSDSELNRGQIDADDSVPEDNEIKSEGEKRVPEPAFPIAGEHFEREDYVVYHRDARARQKDREQQRAVTAHAQAHTRQFSRKNADEEVEEDKSGDKEVQIIDIFPQKRKRKSAEGADDKVKCIKKYARLFHGITSFRVKKRSEKECEAFGELGVIVDGHESDVGDRDGVVVSALKVVVADVEDLVVRVAFLGAEI